MARRREYRYSTAMDLDSLVAAAPSLSLHTERLLLRRFTADDVPFAIEQEDDRAVMRWIRDAQPPAAVRARADTMAAPWQGRDGEWLALTVVPLDLQRAVGLLVCRTTVAEHETMEIGYRLATSVQGRGYASEMCTALCTFLFDVVRVRKLIALCVADNDASSRVLEKLGMQREGRLREYCRLDGGWRDEVVWGLLAREWKAPAR